MMDELAYYYFGDTEDLQHFAKTSTPLFRVAFFEKEIFFMVYEPRTNLNLIYHGVLK